LRSIYAIKKNVATLDIKSKHKLQSWMSFPLALLEGWKKARREKLQNGVFPHPPMWDTQAGRAAHR
jgi:hypothetical protein